VKKQFILASLGVVVVAILFLFGKTGTKNNTGELNNPSAIVKLFSIQENIAAAKKGLSPTQVIYLSKLENAISPNNAINQRIKAYTQLAAFWKDSVKSFEPYLHYIAEVSKLENSEKNLTFAAQLILDNLRSEQDEAKIGWETEQAVALFEKAILLNPNNEDLKIGLGSAYIFGKGRLGSPEETMKGVQQILSVVRKDSTNMKAQLVLGIGGFISKQYDKAVYRLQKVVAAEPHNIEAIAFLADSYAAIGNKREAIKYYEISKRLYNNPTYTKEVDERIKQLK
jgi:tetratricopeptide (TPR) repeat protein